MNPPQETKEIRSEGIKPVVQPWVHISIWKW